VAQAVDAFVWRASRFCEKDPTTW